MWNDLLNMLGIWIVLLRILSTTHIHHGDSNGKKQRKTALLPLLYKPKNPATIPSSEKKPYEHTM
jgi:hypothetical protein